MSDIGGAAAAAGAAGGAEHTAKQLAHVKDLADKEAARRAALGDDTLPEGTYATEAEAAAYIAAKTAAGWHAHPLAEDGSGALTIEVSSPYKGFDTVWLTHVTKERDPSFPSEG